MTGLATSHYIKIDVTLKLKTDATTSETVSFTNRPIYNVDTGEYWPIITAISDIGVAMGNFVPAATNTSFTIDNAPGSFGWQRKFSDKLQRYTCIDQDVTVSFGSTPVDEKTVPTFTTIFKGKVKNLSEAVNDKQQLLTFNIQSNLIDRREIGHQISSTNRTSANIATLKETAINKTVPLILGNTVQVKPIPAEAGSNYTTFFYGSTYSTQFVNSGVQNYYIRDTQQDPDFQAVRMLASTTTNIASMTHAGTNGAGYQYRAYEIPYTAGTTNYIATSVLIRFQGTTDPAFAGVSILFAEIWTKDAATGLPKTKLARAETPKSAYDSSWQAGFLTTFDVSFVFDRPVPLINSSGYFLAIGQTVDASETVGSVQFLHDTSTTVPLIRYQTTGSGDNGVEAVWNKTSSTGARKIYFQLRGVAATTAAEAGGPYNDTNGFSYDLVTLKIAAAAYTNQELPNLEGLDLVFEANGIKDNGSGTLTGSASAVLEKPQHILKLLNYEWNGSTWALNTNKWSTTDHYSTWTNAYTTSFVSRVIAGRTEGRQILQTLIEQLMKNSASRLALRADGKLALWGFGTEQTAAANIPQEDIRVISVKTEGPESVINKLFAYYEKIYTNPDVDLKAAQNDLKDYGSTLDWLSTTNSLTSLLSTQSKALFGDRLLADNKFDWVCDSTSMEHVAYSYLSRFAFPAVNVEIEVPFDKYYALELLDVIKIQSPNLPAYYGAWPDTNPYMQLGQVVNWKLGHYTARAETYRAQIEGRKIKINPNNVPSLVLTCELLLNYPNNPN